MESAVTTPKPAPLERALARLITLAVWLSAACFVAGLLLGMLSPGHAWAPLFDVGIMTLMVTPLLRVLWSSAEAVRTRDWVLLASIAAVAVLLALTLTYASRV